MAWYLERKNLVVKSLSIDPTVNGITRECPYNLHPQYQIDIRCSRYAWPPHQIMAWVGLERYGYLEDAQRLAYRFLYMMTTAFVDFNGVVPEKVRVLNLGYLVTLFRPLLLVV